MADFSIGEKFSPKALPKTVGSSVPITLHRHKAEKAGDHFDLRLGGKGDWAIRYFPKSPGEKRLAVRQPTHPISYYSFSGEIKDGYGKGKVEVEYRGTASISEWSDSKISFSFDGKDYVLIKTRPPNDWIIMMKKPGLNKLSYHRKNRDNRLAKALSLESFKGRLKEIGSKGRSTTKSSSKTNKEVSSSNILRAQDPLSVRDIELNSGPRTRAYRDMALNNIGF